MGTSRYPNVKRNPTTVHGSQSHRNASTIVHFSHRVSHHTRSKPLVPFRNRFIFTRLEKIGKKKPKQILLAAFQIEYEFSSFFAFLSPRRRVIRQKKSSLWRNNRVEKNKKKIYSYSLQDASRRCDHRAHIHIFHVNSFR